MYFAGLGGNTGDSDGLSQPGPLAPVAVAVVGTIKPATSPPSCLRSWLRYAEALLRPFESALKSEIRANPNAGRRVSTLCCVGGACFTTS